MFRAKMPSDWRERGARIVSEHDSVESALTHVERENSRAFSDFTAAVETALHAGAEPKDVRAQSGWSKPRIESALARPLRAERPGDIEALRIAYFTSFEDMLALAAYSHLRLGAKQKDIARLVGSSQSTISTWCTEAVFNTPRPIN